MTTPKKTGRPSSFRPEYVEQVAKLCLLGATDKQMADFFEVSEVTFNAWKKEHPEFLKSLKEAKHLADAEIVHSLYHRAKGYSHPEDDIRTVSLGEGMGSEIVITPTIKHYPPDTTACIFWLKNRQAKIFREKQPEAPGDEEEEVKTVTVKVESAKRSTDS